MAWPAVLKGIADGILDVGGALFQNSAADRQARRSMAFSERMASTQAQRSVADYRAAGLNPALAYDRPASAPGGTAAPVENVVSSALAARQARANIALTEAQAAKVNAEKAVVDTEIGLRTVTEGDEPTWRQEQIAKRYAVLRDLAFQGRLQPHDERLRALAVAMERARLKGVQFRGGLFDDADAVADFIRAGVSSGRGAADAFRAWVQATKSNARDGVLLQRARNAVPKAIRRKR